MLLSIECPFTPLRDALSSSSSSDPYSGNLAATQCDAYSSTYGCSIDDSGNKGASYGSKFKANGGGVWATKIADEGIDIWWWPRNSIPNDIKAGKPVPFSWGIPSFSSSSRSCDTGTFFKDLTFVINIALGEFSRLIYLCSTLVLLQNFKELVQL